MKFQQRRRRLVWTLAVVAALSLSWSWVDDTHGATPTPTHASVPGANKPGAGSEGKTVPMKQALGTLKVAEEGPHDGYDRELFDLYRDKDGDGCDARREVLIKEATEGPQVDRKRGCWLSHGEWYSQYDGERSTNPQDMQIDHVVALNEAWQSGAAKWPKDKLVTYGNYLKDPRHLIAVSGPSNSEKSDKDPAEWTPPRDAYLCRYVADWVQVKARWKLTVDVKEKAALDNLANARGGECGKKPVRLG